MLLKIKNSYNYWECNSFTRDLIEKPFFDKNQCIKLMSIYNKEYSDSQK
jgi:hypothetical protein